MKRIILLLMCVISMVTYAQKTPARKVIPSTNHLSFMGISLGENLNTFKKKLKAINFSVSEYSDEYEYWTLIKGTFAGIKGFNFEIGDYSTNKILNVEGKKKYINQAAAFSDFCSIKKYVENKYPKTQCNFYKFKEVKGYEKSLYIKSVVNSIGKLVGHIYVSFSKEHGEDNDYNNVYFVLSVKYVDYKNNLDCDKRSNYNIPSWCKINNIETSDNKLSYTKYNITNFAYPLYDSCTLDVFDDYIKITATKNGKLYSIYAFDEDRSEILTILFGDVRENYRNGSFQNYMLLAFTKVENYEISTTCSATEAFSAYCDSQQKKQYDNTKQMSKGELWFCLWEGSERIAKYKADGSYQRRMQMFINTWNSIAGSGGGSTNWDGLNDAQKAAIHEHDNAR